MASTVIPGKDFSALTGLSGTLSQTTTAPTYSNSVTTGNVNQTAAYVSFVLGSLTNLNLVFEVSPDGISWFNKPLFNFAGGAITAAYYQIPVTASSMTFTQSQNVVLDIPSCYPYVRFGAFTSGTAAGSSLSISLGAGAV